MIDTIDAWQCIGCGRVIAERPCIGICTDKRVELVQAADYAELAWRVEQLEAAVDRLQGDVERLEQKVEFLEGLLEKRSEESFLQRLSGPQ